ncbi:hypothetical protein B0H13DRAFT_2291922 [Mycena leptocephala]|nr:hypothetical protein B0H13DRAFT_2291922 [Mycena leptocephala]
MSVTKKPTSTNGIRPASSGRHLSAPSPCLPSPSSSATTSQIPLSPPPTSRTPSPSSKPPTPPPPPPTFPAYIPAIRAPRDAAHACCVGLIVPLLAHETERAVLRRAHGACEDQSGEMGAARGEQAAWGRAGGAGGGEEGGWCGGSCMAKIQLDASLRAAAPLVLQSIAAVLASPPPKIKIPHKILMKTQTQATRSPLPSHASSPGSQPPPPRRGYATDDKASTAAASALTELLARPPAAWSPAVLLEPLLLWVGRAFPEFRILRIQTPITRIHKYKRPTTLCPPHQNAYAPAEATREAPGGAGGGGGGVGCGARRGLFYDLFAALSAGYASNAGYAGQMSGAMQGATGTGTQVQRSTLAQTLLRVVLALTAVDPGGARVRLAGSSHSSSASHSSAFGGSSQGSAFGGSASASQNSSGSQGSFSHGGVGVDVEVDGEGGDEDDEDDDEDEDQPSGAPLYFWYLLQEALWEVPAANPHLFPSFPSTSHPFSSTPSSPTQEMDPDDPDLFRARSGGTPWTPGVVRSGSYAFAPSPIVSPMGQPSFAHSSSFGFPSSSSSSSSAFATSASSSDHPFAGTRTGSGEDEREMEREKRETEEELTAEEARTAHARAAYVALVRILRGKVVCGRGRGWGRDRLERFAVYRRDVGDTLVNAYFILRDDLLVFLVAEAEAAAKGVERVRGMWETLEAPLHCLRAVHEALDLDSISTSATSTEHEGRGLAALGRLFGGEVWGRLPGALPASAAHNPTTTTMHNQGHNGANGQGGQEGEALAVQRLRRTALGLVDTYASYFTTRTPDALLPPLQYVLGALADPDPGICLAAALALRSLCDANRRALASKIGAFAEVHAGLGGVPDSEKGKVLQSIASVIQALPPAEAIAPVEAMVGPILQRLGAALGAVGAHPEAARLAAILQLEILAGVAKGLTRTADPMAFDEEDGGGAEADAVRAAREDPRTGALRAALFDAVAQVAELWSADAEVGQALSELFKAITALPADVTLLSLSAGPLLGVVCRAAGRRLNGVWLALAAILIQQLNPPPLILTLKSGPSEEAEACVREAVGGLVTAALGLLGAPGGMVEGRRADAAQNPDIVQEFFACMDRVAQDFTAAFCALPDGAFDALMQCAISALALQERYSLVAAATFLGTLIHRVALYAPISPEQLQLLQAHLIRTHGRAIMRAVLCGFAGAAPRSVTNVLLELLAALVSRWDERAVGEAEGEMREGRQPGSGARGWVAGVVFAEDFFPSKAGQEAKERFVKTVVSSRSVKKTKEAANQFTIVAWGLEGSAFGYSSASSV